MSENTKLKVKLIMVEEKPYIVSLEKIEIGDKVIVTVGGQYPSIVDCENETVLNLLTSSKLSLTQANKIFMGPEKSSDSARGWLSKTRSFAFLLNGNLAERQPNYP